MTPEEKFNQDVWWILQEIRNDEFLTRKGERVEFRVRVQSKTSTRAKQISAPNFPSEDTQRKLLYKLKEWQAIDLEPAHDFFDNDLFNPPSRFLLTIHQAKFTEIYRKYENSIGYQDSQTETPVVVFKNPPLIKSKSLELIAQAIGNLGTGTELIDFLTECGVDGKLIEYPQTKWRMVYAILTTLATSPKIQDQETLFKIIEEAAHPLMHKGDEKAAKQYEEKFNGLLKYDNFALKAGKLKKVDQEAKQDDEGEEDDEENVFSYDGGISSPYENTDLELFILKKILLEHKRRDDSGFFAKELSFNNNSLEDICRVINKLMEDKILYLSVNTRPEKFENQEGIEDKSGFINWKLVKKLDKNQQEMDTESGSVIFDTEVQDEVKLKGRIDIAIEEFMNDKVYTPLGLMMDKSEVDKILTSVENEADKNKKTAVIEALKPKRISYPYYKQRAIIIDEISKDNKEELLVPLNNFRDGQIDVLKTLLALEKENLLRIIELRSNPMYDDNGNFLGKWSEKDKPVARIYALKSQANKQELILIKLAAGSEIKISELEEKIALPTAKIKTIAIPIKDARLDEKNYLMEINNGEKIISFKSKKKGEGLEKETKQFKILYHLWDFHWEMKSGKILKKGDFTSLDNLVKGSESKSTEAAYKHIQRLNSRFKKEGVKIEIAGENEKYRLIINKA